eukprot:5770671-Pleurochrysis_carterae.AAC.4
MLARACIRLCAARLRAHMNKAVFAVLHVNFAPSACAHTHTNPAYTPTQRARASTRTRTHTQMRARAHAQAPSPSLTVWLCLPPHPSQARRSSPTSASATCVSSRITRKSFSDSPGEEGELACIAAAFFIGRARAIPLWKRSFPPFDARSRMHGLNADVASIDPHVRPHARAQATASCRRRAP